MSACELAVEREDHTKTISICTAAYNVSRNPEYALSIASAYRALNDLEGQLALAKKMRGTQEAAKILRDAGTNAEQMGNFAQAIQLAGRSATEYARLQMLEEQAKSLYNQYFYYTQQSSYPEAYAAVTQAWEIAERIDHRYLMFRSLMGYYKIFIRLGDLSAAKNAIDRASDIAPENHPESNFLIGINSAVIDLQRGDFGLALIRLDRLASSLDENDLVRGDWRALYLSLTDAYLGLSKLPDARVALDAAWRYAEPDGRFTHALYYYEAKYRITTQEFAEAETTLRRALRANDVPGIWEWELYHWLGVTAQARRDTKAAIGAYGSAIEILEKMRAEQSQGMRHAYFVERQRAPYEALFELTLAEESPKQAIRYYEMAKARAFLDAIVNVTSAKDVPPSIHAMGSASFERRAAFEEIEGRSDDHSLDIVTETPPIGALLAFFVSDDDLWIMSSIAGKWRALKSSDSAQSISALISRSLANPDDLNTAKALGDALLPSSMLPEKNVLLYVVPDRAIGRLNLGSLVVENRYLIERNPIVYVPSITALQALKLRSLARPTRTKSRVFGDPLRDLPAAAEEAVWVAQHLSLDPDIGERANRSAFESARDASVLHIASHSGLEHDGPWLSLADGKLKMGDILERPIGASLVVLASCASTARDGRDLWGSLAGTFLAAGASNVVASIWSVQDAETRWLIERFYGALLRQEHDAVPFALASAQRQAIAAGKLPSSWAGFVALGI